MTNIKDAYALGFEAGVKFAALSVEPKKVLGSEAEKILELRRKRAIYMRRYNNRKKNGLVKLRVVKPVPSSVNPLI